MESFVILYNKRMIQKVHPLQISAFHAAEKIPGVILRGIALAVVKLRQRKFFQRTFCSFVNDVRLEKCERVSRLGVRFC